MPAGHEPVADVELDIRVATFVGGQGLAAFLHHLRGVVGEDGRGPREAVEDGAGRGARAGAEVDKGKRLVFAKGQQIGHQPALVGPGSFTILARRNPVGDDGPTSRSRRWCRGGDRGWAQARSRT